MNKHRNSEKSQFDLMTSKRFAPFFWTQFLGAFNDNVFRNALLILITYQSSQVLPIQSDILINIAAGLFILPFFIFSATAGQIADKYEKSVLIRRIKLLEIFIMACVAVAFFLNSYLILILLLFLMGTQSSFFGPIKYSIIPDHLKPDEIVGGNAMVEMGTFAAILLGLIAGNVLNPIKLSPCWIGGAICLIAFVGWVSSRSIPSAPPPSPSLKIKWNPFTQTWKTIGYARKTRSVFLSVLGISWFWFLGMSYLTQLPNFTLKILKSTENVYTLLLSIFSIGISIGSLLCEKLSGKKIELGLVPLGSIGLSIFGSDLFFAYTSPDIDHLMGIREFMGSAGSFRVLADLLFIGVFGGFYIVPLFAFVQMRTEPEYRARVIAANNILNALFMVISTLTGALLLGVVGLTIPQFFLAISIANVLVAIYIYTVVPEFVARFLIWMLTHTMYRVTHKNLDNIPDEGPAVLVCNHVSYVDGLLIAGSCRRPVRFVMFEPIYNLPVLNFIFRTGKAIPITSERINQDTFHKAFEQIARALDDDELICIFPEGKLTKDGEMDRFRRGIETIIKRNPVPVVPLALRGLWGSFFSHKNGSAFKRPFRRICSRVELVAGEAFMAEDVTVDGLREAVLKLRGSNR